MSVVEKPKHKKKSKKQKHQEDDDLLSGNMAGIDGLGEVGKPDWMESDSSDDGKIMNNRNNFDLGRPPSRTLNYIHFDQNIYL
jgi:hypothetical protein